MHLTTKVVTLMFSAASLAGTAALANAGGYGGTSMASPLLAAALPLDDDDDDRQKKSVQLQRKKIEERRAIQYQRQLERQQSRLATRNARYQRANRMAQYRYQQEYLERLRQTQLAARAARYDDAAPMYRYNRGGRYYQTNQYGAEMLRQAVNSGYQQGVEAGRADSMDRSRFNYRNTLAYEDANFGYTGYYVNQADYNHYFREGFRRGYEDGYYSRSQYGTNQNGSLGILANVLSAILQLQSLR